MNIAERSRLNPDFIRLLPSQDQTQNIRLVISNTRGE